jgi:nucleoside-diphosphate-sugar epimerase
MKVLFIGGTGNISTAVSRLAIEQGVDLYLLNRGTESPLPGASHIQADISNPEQVGKALKGHQWDVVVNWIAFTQSEVERDIALFRDSAKQYIFISSASAYQKPPTSYIITEKTPLENPFWQYSRDKIACEKRLMQEYSENGFPATIVRPSHTYDTVIPVVYGGWKEYTIIDRLKTGRKIIIHGDGTSLWTLTHSDDFAVGFVGLLGRDQAIGEAYHITSGEVLTWNQIYQSVADAAGCEMNAVRIASDFIIKQAPDDLGKLWGDKSECAVFDNTKIKNLVPEFDAKIPFREGIKRTLNWFEANPDRQLVMENTHQLMDTIIDRYEALG